jgi:selenocysteine-specific elongation factor
MEEIQAQNGIIELGAFRDRLATSRKYAYAILEYCDKKKITQKTGDLRKLTGVDGYLI